MPRPVAQVTALEFWAPGRPAPQGSKRHVGNGRMLEMSKYVKPWRTAVEAAALAAKPAGWVPFDEPLWLRVAFYIPRPARPKFDRPATSPDLSKLVRATEDAITTAGVWVDDSRVVSTLSEEFWAGDRGPGAFIRVSTEELRKGAA